MTCDLQSLNLELSDLKPPIPRDRLIFEEVLVKGRGQLEVAQEHGISQPRVSKILAEVSVWLCRVLPEATAKEQVEGQVALGFWLAQARLEFLYQKALAAFDASGQDKVTLKRGQRGNVAWVEETTRQQGPTIGLLNGALRAATAASRMCIAAAKGSGKIRSEQQGMSPPNPVMSKSAKVEEFSPSELPQTQTVPDLAAVGGDSPEDREAVLQAVIKILRESPKRAHWTDADFREAAERRLAILDARSRKCDEQRRREEETQATHAAALATQKSESLVMTEEPQPSPRQHEPSSISLNAARVEKLRREREKRKRPEQRRREFLAPLAAG